MDYTVMDSKMDKALAMRFDISRCIKIFAGVESSGDEMVDTCIRSYLAACGILLEPGESPLLLPYTGRSSDPAFLRLFLRSSTEHSVMEAEVLWPLDCIRRREPPPDHELLDFVLKQPFFDYMSA